jgi:transcriptional regulator with XRE-family HTH domain
MTLGDKLRTLRELEGHLRGLGRAMTQVEVANAVAAELGRSISQSYLSLIENGTRRHLSQDSRELLAAFFKVHPGFLVNDPPGFHTVLGAPGLESESVLDRWLLEGATRLERDGALSDALDRIAAHPDSRRCLVLLAELVAMPGLIERLSDTLMPKEQT